MKASDYIPTLDFFNFDLYPTAGNKAKNKSAGPEQKGAGPNFQTSGLNKKELLLVIYKTEGASSLDLLKKILAAIDYDLDSDTTLAKIENKQELDVDTLYQKVGWRQALFFVDVPRQIKNSNVKYKSLIENERVLIFADKLSQIAENRDLKKRLWAVLRQVFQKI